MPNISINITDSEGTSTSGGGQVTDPETVAAALTVLAALTKKASGQAIAARQPTDEETALSVPAPETE